MNDRLNRLAIPALRWCVGLIVLWQCAHFAISPPAAREFSKTRLPSWIRAALGVTEIVAAILFLLPATIVTGGYALPVIFLFACTILVSHRWHDLSGLVLYGVAVLVCPARHGSRDAHTQAVP
jgi:hypothetical protein